MGRPLKVAFAPSAAKHYQAAAGLPEVLAPGLKPKRREDLIFHGGRTIVDLTFANFYLGGHQSWQRSDMDIIDWALEAAMADRDLNNVMMQYYGNRPISSTRRPSQVLAGRPSAVMDQPSIEALVRRLHARGKLSGFPAASSVFNLMLPSGTVLYLGAAPARGPRGKAVAARHEADDSLHGLGGYHGSVHVGSQQSRRTLYYAVGVYSASRPGKRDNGIVAFAEPWKNVVATFYHELNEARTDPDVDDAIRLSANKYLGWMSATGNECGDYPMLEAGAKLSLVMKEVPLTDGSGTVPIQFEYSNAVHGPEGPIPAPHK